MSSTVLFRADGSASTGWGHVYRTLALVQMLKDHFKCVFVSHSDPEFLIKELQKLEVAFIKVPAINYSSPEKRKVNDEVVFDMDAILKGNEIVVLDGYWFGTSFQKKVKEKACRLICIDDLHEFEFFADLIINPALGAAETHYRAQPYTRYSVGPGYSLLRPAFLYTATLHHIPKSNSLFVCFGGSDSLGLTVRSLSVLKQVSSISNIHCITGASFTDVDKLQSALSEDRRIVHHHCLDEVSMCSVISNCNYGIAPASGILIEAIACDTSCVTCYYAKNQQDFHAAITKAGVLSVGWVDRGFEETLLVQINKMISGRLSNPGIRQMIGNSKKNFIEKFKMLEL